MMDALQQFVCTRQSFNEAKICRAKAILPHCVSQLNPYQLVPDLIPSRLSSIPSLPQNGSYSIEKGVSLASSKVGWSPGFINALSFG